jgi:hypothetical protein
VIYSFFTCRSPEKRKSAGGEINITIVKEAVCQEYQIPCFYNLWKSAQSADKTSFPLSQKERDSSADYAD